MMSKKSIAVYRMPKEQDFFSLESELPILQDDEDKSSGFYFSDFETGTQYSIRDSHPKTNSWPNFDPHFNETSESSDQNYYLAKIKEISEKISEGVFTKVVFSKIKNREKKNGFELKNTFLSLCKKHPNAFVYCISTPKFGTWMGATPELLIDTQNSKFKTVSLAGTRTKEVEWTKKERKEQQVVTDFITQNIAPFCTNMNVSKPHDLDTGSVIHLKSDIEGELKKENSIWEITDVLHPTPAVCGIPTQLAKKYILQNEKHKRELYTGFIGPMNLNNHSSLFVNLRCMQIGKKMISLYLGGGIMADSIPQNEWIETENKAKTLLTVLTE
jgi:isochorismate synthase